MEKTIEVFGEWKVTEWGIEYKAKVKSLYRGPYDIEKSRVHESDWESHMIVKNWVFMPDFMRALNYARNLWPKED
jgi:hypothetical protein